MSELEDLLYWQLCAIGIHAEREQRLVPGRMYRWDLVVGKWAIEIQGGTWQPHSGHTSGRGIARDLAKHNCLMRTHYRDLFYTGEQVRSGEAATEIGELCR
jgi:hypothetical protein